MRSTAKSAGLPSLIFAFSLAFSLAGPRAVDGTLSSRAGPAPKTTEGVPHVQIDAEAVPEQRDELLRRVALLPGLEIRPTVVGMWGGQGFWLGEELALVHPEVIFRGREFAHVHADGSLHASLPPERAFEAIAAGWAVRHPSSQYHARLEGFVMLFSPRTAEETDVIFSLIVDGYNFIAGRDEPAERFR